jgi:outer membrane lipoprotein SlyB
MLRTVLMVPVALFGLAACVDPSASTYSSTATTYNNQSQRAEYGTVIRIENIRTQTGSGNQLAGTILGGVAGAAVGNQFGNGSGKAVMTGAGALGGAMIGSNIANTAQTRTDRQITVRLESGKTIAIIQNTGAFRVGQNVSLSYNGNVATLNG